MYIFSTVSRTLMSYSIEVYIKSVTVAVKSKGHTSVPGSEPESEPESEPGQGWLPQEALPS